MRQSFLCGIILVLNACNSDPSVAPPGTIQTAQRLKLALGAGLNIDSTVSVLICLADDVTYCGISEVTLSTTDCHDYLGAEFTLDDAVITQREPGGYSPDGQGCTYPTFKATFPSQQLVPNGPHQLTLSIAGEGVSLAIAELFEKRSVMLTGGKLIGGSDASVVVSPRPILISDVNVGFEYDNFDLNGQWCSAKHGWSDCYSTDLTMVPVDAWNDQGFSFPVPTNMPSGIGTLSIDYQFRDDVAPCPFAECHVSIGNGRLVDIPNVEVMQP